MGCPWAPGSSGKDAGGWGRPGTLQVPADGAGSPAVEWGPTSWETHPREGRTHRRGRG